MCRKCDVEIVLRSTHLYDIIINIRIHYDVGAHKNTPAVKYGYCYAFRRRQIVMVKRKY